MRTPQEVAQELIDAVSGDSTCIDCKGTAIEANEAVVEPIEDAVRARDAEIRRDTIEKAKDALALWSMKHGIHPEDSPETALDALLQEEETKDA